MVAPRTGREHCLSGLQDLFLLEGVRKREACRAAGLALTRRSTVGCLFASPLSTTDACSGFPAMRHFGPEETEGWTVEREHGARRRADGPVCGVRADRNPRQALIIRCRRPTSESLVLC